MTLPREGENASMQSKDENAQSDRVQVVLVHSRNEEDDAKRQVCQEHGSWLEGIRHEDPLRQNG